MLLVLYIPYFNKKAPLLQRTSWYSIYLEMLRVKANKGHPIRQYNCINIVLHTFHLSLAYLLLWPWLTLYDDKPTAKITHYILYES